jgi:alpha-amylase
MRASSWVALGAVGLAPACGGLPAPQILWGDEIAMYGGADPDNRRDMPAWAWSASTRAGAHAGMGAGDGQAAYVHVQSLIAIRKAHLALQETMGIYAL